MLFGVIHHEGNLSYYCLDIIYKDYNIKNIRFDNNRRSVR